MGFHKVFVASAFTFVVFSVFYLSKLRTLFPPPVRSGVPSNRRPPEG